MLPTAEQPAARAAAGPGPELLAVAFNTHRDEPMDLIAFANHSKVGAPGPASAGGTGTARGIAGMYAAAIGELDGRAPLLKPETLAECAKQHTRGADLVTTDADRFALGFARQPAVGPEAFGHSGAVAGAQGFADPVTGIAYGYTRRRFAFPGGSAPENERLTAAVLGVARGL
ncbi:serine hydrolase [Streptomyces sp. NPDC048269]|uniref:serine hydrolase n=1 Tax=Streptomyces sp. NPDC048269 TaxID=3155753 RepID=UPI00342B719E